MSVIRERSFRLRLRGGPPCRGRGDGKDPCSSSQIQDRRPLPCRPVAHRARGPPRPTVGPTPHRPPAEGLGMHTHARKTPRQWIRTPPDRAIALEPPRSRCYSAPPWAGFGLRFSHRGLPPASPPRSRDMSLARPPTGPFPSSDLGLLHRDHSSWTCTLRPKASTRAPATSTEPRTITFTATAVLPASVL